MGNLQASPSSSTTTPEEKYDVFINFRGKDIRYRFANTLREALLGKHIKTFMDDQHSKGERILQLFKTIEESKISIVIFSEDYGSSEWCLNELVKILEHKKINKQTVIPVFYGVKPSAVREDSFVKLKEKFPEEVPKWKEALIDASRLEGWESSVTRPDTKLVNAIVDDIYKKLTGENILSPSDFKGLIGLDERIKQIKSLLCLQKTDVRIIGIWGMGGIGKTTLAEVVFNQISGHPFEGVCFIQNVREKLENSGGLDCLQEDILHKVLNDNKLQLDSPCIIPPIIKKRLNQTKVFIILDDVDDFRLLETLARRVDGLGQGSRIIITSRDKLVLQNCGVNDQNIYEVEEFNRHEALQLFCNRAFNQNQPTEDLRKLSNDIVNYARGNPLALTVLGSSLNQKSKKVWESAVNKLRTNVDRKIFDVLKISYDGLNAGEQEVFLDIACFLKGHYRDYVATILDDCEYSLSVLIDKSLITISYYGSIEMHDLLQDLGRDIVHKESPKKPGERSRLWRQEDVQDTLKHGDGTNAVQGIFLDIVNIKKDLHLSLEAFNKMYNLRLLKFNDHNTLTFNKVQFREVLKNATFDKLRSFIWFGYPFPSLPSNFNLENLVELDLSNSSKLKRLWEDNESAPKLKWLRLNDCPRLIEIPDLSGSPLFETIGVENCRHLLDFPLLDPRINCLRDLNICGCESLRSFPSYIHIHFESLTSLDLSSCINLTTFPWISGNLYRLDMSGTAIEEVPPSIENLIKLSHLNLSKCTRLKHITTNICRLKSLEELDLENCSQLERFPEILDKMESLKILNLSGTAIKELPHSIENLNELSKLYLRRCNNLEMLPNSISLTSLDFNDCNLNKIPEDIGRFPSLECLELSGNNFESLPKSMKQLHKLTSLKVDNCNMLQSLTDLPSALKHLSASGCKQLRTIPDASEFANLTDAEFIFTNCLNLEETAVGNMLATLKEGYEEGDEIGVLAFCCPGSKIPGWFTYRAEGSIVELNLQMSWHDCLNGRPLLGFVVCAVIAFEENCYINHDLWVHYNSKLGDGDESSNDFPLNFSDLIFGYMRTASRNGTLIDSDHIAFGVCWPSVPSHRAHDRKFRKCTFKFGLSNKNSKSRIKSCGVCPIYVKHNIKQPSFKKQKI